MGSCYPVLQLGYDSVTAGSQVHPLGVDISSDLSLDQHVSQVNAIYFYWPHQLQQIWRSMDPVSIASLVHACHYSNRLLHLCQRAEDKLQHVLKAVCCVLSAEEKSLTAACHNCCMMNSTGLMCLNELLFRLAVTVHQCLNVFLSE